MSLLLPADPFWRALLVSLALLLASYLGALAISWLFGRLVLRAALRTETTLDDRLLEAVKRPITYALFLLGAYGALLGLPIPERWSQRLDALLFVFGAGLLTLGLLRAWGILLQWYSTESAAARDGGAAREFGPLFSKLGKVFLVLVASIAVFRRFGIDVNSLVVSLGVSSLAVGLAARDTLANMFAGFALLLDRPFLPGERIRLASGDVGDVEAIGMRATRLRTLDETLLVIPNTVLVNERLVNLSRPTRAVTTRLEVGVAYGSDLDQARRLLGEAALSSDKVDRQRPPVVLVTRFGDFAVHLLLVFWARDYAEQGLAASEVHEAVYRRFAAAGIEIPYPTRRVIQEPAAPAPAAAPVGEA